MHREGKEKESPSLYVPPCVTFVILHEPQTLNPDSHEELKELA